MIVSNEQLVGSVWDLEQLSTVAISLSDVKPIIQFIS